MAINKTKIQNICNFYAMAHRLKNILRSGPVVWQIDAERLESVAEHVYGTQMLALAINSEFNLGLDIAKVALMLAIHELSETILGDVSVANQKMSGAEKRMAEMKAIETILAPLNNSQMIKDVFIEFEKRETREAKFAYFCDKLECSIQCKFYEETGCTDFDKQREGVFAELIRQSKENGCKTFAKAWIEYDKNNFDFAEFNQLFANIADYVADNDIFNN